MRSLSLCSTSLVCTVVPNVRKLWVMVCCNCKMYDIEETIYRPWREGLQEVVHLVRGTWIIDLASTSFVQHAHQDK